MSPLSLLSFIVVRFSSSSLSSSFIPLKFGISLVTNLCIFSRFFTYFTKMGLTFVVYNVVNTFLLIVKATLKFVGHVFVSADIQLICAAGEMLRTMFTPRSFSFRKDCGLCPSNLYTVSWRVCPSLILRNFAFTGLNSNSHLSHQSCSFSRFICSFPWSIPVCILLIRLASSVNRDTSPLSYHSQTHETVLVQVLTLLEPTLVTLAILMPPEKYLWLPSCEIFLHPLHCCPCFPYRQLH